ncbi:ankyrin repeat domain-containing protein [bacterium]|nr:ankyrin repeat domain-containing protein [bacterium]
MRFCFLCALFLSLLCCNLNAYIYDSYKEFMNILGDPDLSRLMRSYKLKQLISDNVDVNASRDGYYILNAAISCENTEIVRLLLESGADPNIIDQSGRTPLQRNFDGYVKDYSSLLLENGADPDTLISGEPILLYAYKNNKMDLVQKLVDNGVNPDVVDSYGYSVLYRVIQMDSTEILDHFLQLRPRMSSGGGDSSILVDLLYRMKLKQGSGNSEIDYRKMIENFIRNKTGINKQNYRGKTPLYIAMEQDDLEMVKLLLDNGARTEIVDNEGKTVLYSAVVQNKIDFIRIFIEKGADPNIIDNNGVPMLHAAIDNGNVEILELLKKNYLNLDIIKDGNFKVTAIHHALLYKDIVIAKWLIRNGADFNIADKNKLYPLDYAIQFNLNKVITFLNRMKAKRSNRSIGIAPYSLQQTNKNDNAPTADSIVMKSCKKGNVRVLKRLIKDGADIEALGPDGKTLLHYAVYSGSEDTIRLLLDSGLDIEIKSTNGETAFTEAVKKKKLNLSEFLLQNGAYIDSIDRKGLTPLHYAVLNKDSEMVELLLSYNADSTVKDKNNKTVIDIPTSDEIKDLLSNP